MKTKKTIKGINPGKYSIFFVLLFMILVSSLLNKNFLSAGNMTNVARQLAVGTILAYGEMILIISGMLDLSAGSVLALSGLLSVGFYKNMVQTMGVYPTLTIAFFLAIFIAVLCNIFNAVLVTNLHVPSFIATLAMQTIARGIALLYTKGQNILQIGDYKIIGQGQIWVIPTQSSFWLSLRSSCGIRSNILALVVPFMRLVEMKRLPLRPESMLMRVNTKRSFSTAFWCVFPVFSSCLV